MDVIKCQLISSCDCPGFSHGDKEIKLDKLKVNFNWLGGRYLTIKNEKNLKINDLIAGLENSLNSISAAQASKIVSKINTLIENDKDQWHGAHKLISKVGNWLFGREERLIELQKNITMMSFEEQKINQSFAKLNLAKEVFEEGFNKADKWTDGQKFFLEKGKSEMAKAEKKLREDVKAGIKPRNELIKEIEKLEGKIIQDLFNHVYEPDAIALAELAASIIAARIHKISFQQSDPNIFLAMVAQNELLLSAIKNLRELYPNSLEIQKSIEEAEKALYG